MKLTTTLNRIKQHDPCSDGYRKLLNHLGREFDPDAPVDLLTILESNGIDDCLWALRATEQDCEKVARLMAADFAERVLPIFEAAHPDDSRPRNAIEAARRYARGEATESELSAARDAARDATGAATRAAAWAATGAAAWAAEKEKQADIIRVYLSDREDT